MTANWSAWNTHGKQSFLCIHKRFPFQIKYMKQHTKFNMCLYTSKQSVQGKFPISTQSQMLRKLNEHEQLVWYPTLQTDSYTEPNTSNLQS